MARAGWIVAIVLGTAPSVVIAQERVHEWGWGMHPMWGAWGAAWGIGMMLMMAVFWGAVIVGLALAIRWIARQGKESRAPDAALDILRQRYARGEIGKDEFDAKKRDLA